MAKVKEFLGKIGNFLLSESFFRLLCFFLIGMSLILAIDTGIKGEYKTMHSHINWVLWVGIAAIYSYRVEYEEMKTKAYQEYIKSTEKYMEASEAYTKSLEETAKVRNLLIKNYEDQIKNLQGKDI